MKAFLLIILCAPLLVLGSESKDDLCLRRLKLKREVMEPLLKELIHPVDGSLDYNNFLECFWKELGYMKSDGTLLWDNIREDYESKFNKSDKLTIVINNCKYEHLVGNTYGQTAVKNQNCLMQGVKDNRLIG